MWQAQHCVLCKGLILCSGVPNFDRSICCGAQHLLLCKGSDVCWRTLISADLRVRLCVAGVPHVSLRMYAMASGPRGFCKEGAALSALHGFGWFLASLGLQWLARRGTWCFARFRMYALVFLGLRCFLRGRKSTSFATSRTNHAASLGFHGLVYFFAQSQNVPQKDRGWLSEQPSQRVQKNVQIFGAKRKEIQTVPDRNPASSAQTPVRWEYRVLQHVAEL